MLRPRKTHQIQKTQIPRYRLKFNQNLNLNLYHVIPRNRYHTEDATSPTHCNTLQHTATTHPPQLYRVLPRNRYHTFGGFRGCGIFRGNCHTWGFPVCISIRLFYTNIRLIYTNTRLFLYAHLVDFRDVASSVETSYGVGWLQLVDSLKL